MPITGVREEIFLSNLKKIYSPKRQQSLAFGKDPFLNAVKVKTTCSGLSESVYVQHSDPQARSATFDTANSLAADATFGAVQFEIKPKRNYSLLKMDNLFIRQSRNDAGAFLTTMTQRIDGTLRSLARDVSRNFFRTGWGDIGQASSPGASTTLTLANPGDARNFHVNMFIQGAANLGSGALRASGAQAKVIGTNYSAGTVTLNVNADTIFQNGDFIFPAGDRQNVVSPARLKMHGVKDWIPAAAPSPGESFNGVDRSISDLLFGARFDANAEGVDDLTALMYAAEVVTGNGGMPTHLYVGTRAFRNLMIQKEGEYTIETEKGGRNHLLGAEGMSMMLGGCKMKVFQSINVPDGEFFMLQMDTWEIKSWGPFLSILDEDGKVALREVDADSYGIRAGHYADIACDAPGWNLYGKFKAA